ncbi:outer membrane protein [Desulfosalsimonas propionicica]|uniref:Outer membrane protein n=1 Tax=Desulfosalsimonas propionicica TaxID=332175 RepID=A0A7W0HK38_9BACT|nr:TolC family protein [Desulfosalsimonas propionicica]MBA2880671.1 outer membrane protein [Desulfosalsimonas propionicica]
MVFLAGSVIPAKSAGFPLEISLEDAYRLALKKNPGIAEQRARQDIATSLRQQAMQGYLPTLSFDASYLRFDSSLISDVPVPVWQDTGFPPALEFQTRDFGPIDGYITGFSAVQPILNLEAWLAGRQAAHQTTAAGLALSRGERELALHLIEAYYGVIVAEKRLDVEKTALEAARKTLQLASSSFEEGLVAPVDVYSARAQTFEFKARVSDSRGQAAVALAQLHRVMGLEEDANIVLTDKIPDPPAALPKSLYPGKAVDRRMDIQAQQKMIAAAEAGVNRAGAAFTPEINLFGRYQWMDHDHLMGRECDMWGVAVNLKWTIFAGMSRSGKVAEARARKRREDAKLRELRQQARAEAQSSRAEWEAAMAGWDYSRQAVENAAAALDQTRARYREGIDGITELLRAQAEDLKARLMNLNARYEAVLAVSRYRLQALGAHPMKDFQ